MRILIISDHADPLAEIGSKESGGQNIFIYYLAFHLARLGVNVDVFTRWNRINKKQIVKINNNLRIVRIKAGPKHYISRDGFFEIVPEFTKNILKFITKEKLKYDIIHSNHWYSGLAGLEVAKRLKVPHVFVFHAIGKIRYEKLKELHDQASNYQLFIKRQAMETKIVREVTQVIATSPTEKENIKRIFHISSKKITMITEGVDTKIFRQVSTHKARKLLGFRGSNRIILYVGRIEWRKGIGTLLHAFARLIKKEPTTRLYIIGGGKSKEARKLDEQERARLQTLAKKLGISRKVYFLGPKEQKKLYLYYNAADVCVVPSYYEFFGIVPLEAMACGVPVVASRTGGLKFTVVDGVTGYHAKTRDATDFADKISQVLEKGKKSFTPNCLKRIYDNFMWEEIALNYMVYFKQLIKQQDT